MRFKRARVCDVYKKNGSTELTVKYAPEFEQVAEEEFDMVVLSVGLEPSEQQRSLAAKLGVRLDPNGFIWTDSLRPLETSRPGILVGGTASGPKDIPETVTQASGIAGKASQLLSDVRGTLTVEREFPSERDVGRDEPRIGVFVCHCGINIGSVVDVPPTAEYAKSLPYVVYAEDNLYTCSQDTQDHIREMILEHNLNRVVVASCSPRTHEPLFQQTLREAGLNPHLFEMANIRDQCSWIHMNEPEEATEKARDLVRMAVAKVALVEPLSAASLDMTSSALVVGGGLAGMTAALAVAEQEFDVHLIERSKELGGMVSRIYYTIDGKDIRGHVAHLIEKIKNHPKIRIYTNTYIVNASGYVGNFTTEIMRYHGRVCEKIEHGVAIIATGANEYKPDEYLYSESPTVLTQLELEEKIAKQKPDITGCNNLVMILCAGSRNGDRPYCSRVCCNQAIKNALKLKQIKPEMNIYVLYRDMRTYGFYEQYYQDAREKGVIFIRYAPECGPQVKRAKKGKGNLLVEVRDPVLGEDLAIDTDILALSVPIVPPDEAARELAMSYKVPLNEDNFFLEAHVKLRPVEFATEGVFVAGLAHSPKSIPETIAQAEAAAAKACTIISKEKYEAEATVAALNEELCDGCGICVPVCEYNALEIVDRPGGEEGEKILQLNEAMCKGCGGCVAACPSGAMEQKGFKNEQMLAMIKAALAD